MIDTPQIIQTETRQTAVIKLLVPSAKIRDFMGPGIQELMAAVAAQGITPTGPWFTHHFKRPKENFDFEISVPVARPVTPAGRVTPGIWPAMKLIRTVYRGPYEGLPQAWPEFEAWVKNSGHAVTEDFWECYNVGPESGPDGSKYETELNWPLA